MNDAEWVAVAELLEHSFAGEFGDAQERVYRARLGGMPYTAVVAGVNDLINKNKGPFTPVLGDIVEAVRNRGRPPVPSFNEAWTQVEKALADSRNAVARLERMGAIEEVVAWVQSYGPLRMGQLEVGDPVHGGAVLHGLRQSYMDFLDRAAQRRAQGLPLVDEGVARAAGLAKPDFGKLGRPPLRALEDGEGNA